MPPPEKFWNLRPLKSHLLVFQAHFQYSESGFIDVSRETLTSVIMYIVRELECKLLHVYTHTVNKYSGKYNSAILVLLSKCIYNII